MSYINDAFGYNLWSLEDSMDIRITTVRIATEEKPQWLWNLLLGKRGPMNDSDIEALEEDLPRRDV